MKGPPGSSQRERKSRRERMMPPETNLEARNPTCGGNSVAKFSLAVQQFTHCNAHQSPSSSHSETMGFSLGAHSQLQPSSSQTLSHFYIHSQRQVPPSHHQSKTGENGVATSSSCQNLHQAFPLGLGQGRNLVYGAQGLHDSSLGGLRKAGFPEVPAFSLTSPHELLSSLSLLQKKIQQVQAVVQLMGQGNGHSVAQQQAVAAGVASVISQWEVATAGMIQQSAEPTNHTMAADLQLNRLCEGVIGSEFNTVQQSGLGHGFGTAPESLMGSSHGNVVSIAPSGCSVGEVASIGAGISMPGFTDPGIGGQKLGEQCMCSPSVTSRIYFPPSLGHPQNNFLDMDAEMNGKFGVGHGEGAGNPLMVHNAEHLQGSLEEHDSGMGLKDEDDDGEGESLPPGSYELVEMDAIEILAEHTHFCEICGKGFKRDANLRMHMRGHGDEYKTPAALARPGKSFHEAFLIKLRRYSCPYVGCKRNKKHHKFQPLKTMLCVKNHYRRSHCPKMLTCSRCKTKKFSVVADLKTHEKHCGCDKWQCSCGTTFSRKDKLFGHIGLFAGHTPAFGRGDSRINGSGGFTPAASSTSHGGSKPAFLAGSGSNHFGHENRPLIGAALVAGNCSVMDVGNGAGMGVEVGGNICRGMRLQFLGLRGDSLSISDGASLGHGSFSPAGFGGSLVPGSSMFQDILSNNFLQQVNGNTQDSSDVLQ